jgi:type I restriction enzyme M protein
VLAYKKLPYTNDYNLNIPRYVDTFEAEESIDINAIANDLKALETEMKATDKSIAEFCAELNISTPF